MKGLKSILAGIPKCNFSIIPTPIHKLENISKKYKVSVYCMRDDLTGFAFGGNKTRKLDFLIADAKNKGYDTLIGVGANQSNFCRMTAAAGKMSGLDVHLLLSGEKPHKPTANLMLDHLFEAVIHHTNASDNEAIENESKKLEIELQKQGRKVYRMPLGGSTPIGTLGYLKAFTEILDYCMNEQTWFSKIFLASGSGGTQAGIVLGQQLYKWKGEVIGISVGRSKTELTSVISEIIKGTCEFLKSEYEPVNISVDDSFIGEGYGKPTKECETAIAEFANLEGILLDRVYTGKAAAGMLNYIAKGKIKPGENILFIHTGGNIELFE